MTMPAHFTLRPYTPADAAQVVAVINAAAQQTLGAKRAVVDGVGQVRLSRYVPQPNRKVVAVNVQGEIVGYAYFVVGEQAITSELGGAVHPQWWGQGIGTGLVTWGQEQAQRVAGHAPPGARTVLQANLFEAETAALELFTSLGFAKVREWVHLAMHLDQPPARPEPPAGLVLRPMDLENDWDLVGPAMDEAFADHWGAITLPPAELTPVEEAPQESVEEDESYSNTPGVCFICLDGEIVAGGILCNARLVERPDTGRVGSLFVRPPYRRRGLGRTLMLAALQAFWQRGLRRIITDTDGQSFTAAPRLYAQLGMSLYRREFLYEYPVRPGQELRRLTL
jgi:mycothiol synthase